jgi:hypothetical protein
MDGDRVRWRDRAWRLRPLSATGAWSLNDSWATNITTMITLLATILGVTTASGALFPGVALDRFVIVNLVAGGIVAVAPLAFGVFYAGWTRHNPGIMADASLVLPQAVALTLASPAEFALAGNTPVVLTASGRKKSLRATAVATVDRGTVVRWRGSGTATLPSGASALIPRTAVARHGLPPWPARVTLAADANATLDSVAPADAGQVPAAVVDAPSGADVMLPGGATVTAIDDGRQEPVTVKTGHPVHVPPQTRISILAGAIMTIPGTPDITVDTASILVVSRSRTGGGTGGGTGGSLTIPSDDVDPGKGTAADATVAYPARIEAAAGAKVTVAGVVDVTLPAGTISRASYRAEAKLVTERALQVPAGANVLFGNLQMILAVAVVTMFGIGAEIGIAGVLAYGLSEAGQPWRVGMLAVIALVGLLTIAYAVTAIRAIADPRPGSSISSTSGTSFTL